MTAIWREDETGWQLLAPAGFPREATLHDLIEANPQILPLAGEPRLTIIGREVQLGSGYADLVAVETSGRMVILEIKLASNAEARRAVISQILAYAAFLFGTDVETLEQSTLRWHLRHREFETLADAVTASDQEGAFDPDVFREGLAESLANGRFRLIIVLDQAPEELVRLVGYLETVTDGLLIDLVTVSRYDVNGSQVMVPQRVDPERKRVEAVAPNPARKDRGEFSDGSDVMVRAIDTLPEPERSTLRKLVEWAESLQREGLVRLGTFIGVSGRMTLLPRLIADDVGLVTVWKDGDNVYISVWRSVFDRLAPNAKGRVEEIIHPKTVGQRTSIYEITDDLLVALTAAYREAAG